MKPNNLFTECDLKCGFWDGFCLNLVSIKVAYVYNILNLGQFLKTMARSPQLPYYIIAHPSTCKDIFRSTSRLPTIVATNDVTYEFALLKCYWWKYVDLDLHHAYEHELLVQHLLALPSVLYLNLNISMYFGIYTFHFGSLLYSHMYNEC